MAAHSSILAGKTPWAEKPGGLQPMRSQKSQTRLNDWAHTQPLPLMLLPSQYHNRFKGLDLTDRVPDELWTEAPDIVQDTGIKTIPKKKNCENAKRLSEEALQIAVKRRDAKSKEEKERYTHLNAEFQRIARRDKKAFLRDQCKEIEENNRMGKTRDLVKKIRDTKGTLHPKIRWAQ